MKKDSKNTGGKNKRQIRKKMLAKLSPLQKKIILELSRERLSLCELSKKINHCVFSVGKQLSILQFRTKYNPLLKKGISKPLVAKNKEAGKKTTYALILAK